MSATLPPRWYRALFSSGDISEFALHLRQVNAVPGRRAFPSAVAIQGDAFHLIRAIYKVQNRALLARFVSAALGKSIALAIAKETGMALWERYSGNIDPIAEDVTYIFRHYMALEKETESSGVLYYQDSRALDNHYWDPDTYQ